MNIYSQLPDAELERKTLELMGYSVKISAFDYAAPFPGDIYRLCLNGKTIDSRVSEESAWSHAPHPLTDANVYMGLVDWFYTIGYMLTVHFTNEVFVEVHAFREYEPDAPRFMATGANPGRAICEVYCMVKEGK